MAKIILQLTHGETDILTKLAAEHDPDADYENTEITEFTPGGWYYGTAQISGAVCKSLMRMVLISEVQPDGGSTHRYRINEWGRAALAGEEINVPPELIPFMRVKK